MSELTPEAIVNGQAVLRTVEQTGTMVASGGTTDTTCVVNASDGKQLAVKVFVVGAGAGKPQYVAELPETGEDGVLYLVPTGTTRDGYAIFQEFTWKDDTSEWVAIGAFDVGITPTGILYETSFNSSTNTLTVTPNN